jgi:hypothetical protein
MLTESVIRGRDGLIELLGDKFPQAEAKADVIIALFKGALELCPEVEVHVTPCSQAVWGACTYCLSSPWSTESRKTQFVVLDVFSAPQLVNNYFAVVRFASLCTEHIPHFLVGVRCHKLSKEQEGGWDKVGGNLILKTGVFSVPDYEEEYEEEFA